MWKYIKEKFLKQKKTREIDGFTDQSFHPEFLFLINLPYAEYVDFEEVKDN